MAYFIPLLGSDLLSRMTSGERRLARQLKIKLDDDYLIWYDVPIGDKRLRPDFIILHPQRGLFVLEVKDWRLDTISQGNPDQFSISPQGVEKQVQHPLRQAETYAIKIKELLEQVPGLREKSGQYKGKLLFPYAYGVVFANITRKGLNSQPGLPQLINVNYSICKDEMAPSVDPSDFQEKLWAMSPYNFGNTLTKAQIDQIRYQLYPDIRIDAATEPETAFPPVLKLMDLQQEQLARSLGTGHRVVHGVTGSGKTLLLLYRCQYMVETFNQPILVLCYNVALANWLKKAIEKKGLSQQVKVFHFHRWCRELLKRHCHRELSDCAKQQGQDYYQQLVQSTIQAVGSGNIPIHQYGAVMIDEGHDFKQEWLKLAVQMVDPQTDSLLFLYDDAQQIYSQTNRKGFSLQSVGIKARGRTTILDVNYRNTIEIMTFAYEFAKEDIQLAKTQPANTLEDDTPLIIQPKSAGRHGPLPELTSLRSFSQEVNLIKQKAVAFHEQGIPWREMAIFCRSRRMGKEIARQLNQADIPVEWLSKNGASRYYQPNQPSIKLMTLHASKGLEFPVVFIPGIGDLPHPKEDPHAEARLLYVAMTRSIEYLILSYSQRSEFVPRLRSALSKVTNIAAA